MCICLYICVHAHVSLWLYLHITMHTVQYIVTFYLLTLSFNLFLFTSCLVLFCYFRDAQTHIVT